VPARLHRLLLPLVAATVVVVAACATWVEASPAFDEPRGTPVDTVELRVPAMPDELTWDDAAEVWARWTAAALAAVTLVALALRARRVAVGSAALAVATLAAPASQVWRDDLAVLTTPFWLALWGTAVLLGCAVSAPRRRT